MVDDNVLLFNEDCFDALPKLPAGSVDLIVCDPPYGVTACDWDVALDLARLWPLLVSVTKPNAAIVMFSQQPFTCDLINSNREMFRYDLIYEKTTATGFLNANRMPLRAHENICVFYKKLPTYNPQKTTGHKASNRVRGEECPSVDWVYGHMEKRTDYKGSTSRHPRSVFKCSNGKRDSSATRHPTQKPQAVLQWLIKTYSTPGDAVLDFAMGTGSTGEACVAEGRNFVGIERDDNFYSAAFARLKGG